MGRPGRLGSATRQWAKAARDEGLKPADPKMIMVELAIDAADMADRARVAKDDRVYLAAAARLQQLITVVDRDRGDDGGRPAADPWAERMAELVGACPDMGHAAEL